MDETDQQAVPDVTSNRPSQEKWGWIMFECGLENLTIKGKVLNFCFKGTKWTELLKCFEQS